MKAVTFITNFMNAKEVFFREVLYDMLAKLILYQLFIVSR